MWQICMRYSFFSSSGLFDLHLLMGYKNYVTFVIKNMVNKTINITHKHTHTHTHAILILAEQLNNSFDNFIANQFDFLIMW